MLPRLFLLTLILFCLEMGVFLVVLPWTGLWEHNYFLFRYPFLASVLLDNRLRGVISGLGLLDLGVAFWYVTHFEAMLTRWREGAPPALPPRPRESLTRGQTA